MRHLTIESLEDANPYEPPYYYGEMSEEEREERMERAEDCLDEE